VRRTPASTVATWQSLRSEGRARWAKFQASAEDRVWHREDAPEQRARRLTSDFDELRRRYADRIFGFTEAAALIYGALMGERTRSGRPMSVPDGMIAAIARTHGAKLATRNLGDFAGSGLELISPWAA
jgi:predicted nucleic acid-binding protein